MNTLRRWFTDRAPFVVAAGALGLLLAFAPGLAFADAVRTMEIPVSDSLTLVGEVDDEGVLRIADVVTADDGIMAASEAADAEEVLFAIARVYSGWYQSNTGDWYYFVDGKWATGWYKVDGWWYHFAVSNGIMQTGWLSRDGNWYYLRTASGVPVSGPTGAMVENSWVSLDGYWYYFQSVGSMLHGWHKEGTTYYYLRDVSKPPINGPDGSMAIGWEKVDDEWFYFNANGSMYAGKLNYDGYDYYLADEYVNAPFGTSGYGVMLTGFHDYMGFEYYYVRNSDRSAFTGPIGPEGSLVKNGIFNNIDYKGGKRSGYTNASGRVKP
ncbi:hypothetical protein [Adlercreutzia aquisgranensis]|uniref:hypothetical protein n=1 Tax=Adlercreutzia aquisgranensis TaxID=2941323 RepID=UPI00203FC0B7|nr:hypothetical protein [Adlercreutzia aquisgranensis]